jgi:UDP-GlcNAc3NAcA epimerase
MYLMAEASGLMLRRRLLGWCIGCVTRNPLKGKLKETMKIVTIIGARPQFIQAAPLSNYIAGQDDVEEILIHTGQHYDENMSDVFFEEMHIPKPKYNLALGGGTHGKMTGRMLEGIEKILLEEQPDWVLVFGDTNSTLAGALAAKKLHIKVAHVEAGLRSYNMAMPEEVNRILTDRISSILFCPSQKAVDNLQLEGSEHWDTKVIISGDIMKDAANFYAPKARMPEGFELPAGEFHRAENTDVLDRLSAIFSALREIAQTVPVVLPLHPRTRQKIATQGIATGAITIIEPVGYLNMVWLLDNCKMVFTDSGGLQKEAYYFSTPCITLRDETEWVELVEQGHNALVGADAGAIIGAWQGFDFNLDFSANIYGAGETSQVIIGEMWPPVVIFSKEVMPEGDPE